MRTDVLIKWDGQKVLERAKRLEKAAPWTIGLVVLSDAKALCPVKFGYLAASLMASSPSQDKGFGDGAVSGPKPSRYQHIAPPDVFGKTSDVLVGTAVEYAEHVEYGTFYNEAQPFLRPAHDMARGKVLELVKRDAKIHFAEYLYQHDAYVASRAR